MTEKFTPQPCFGDIKDTKSWSRLTSNVGYPQWLFKQKGIDWGQQYTYLGKKTQELLIKEYEDFCWDEAQKMSGGQNWG